MDNINPLYMWTCTKCNKLEISRLGDVRLEFKMANVRFIYKKSAGLNALNVGTLQRCFSLGTNVSLWIYFTGFLMSAWLLFGKSAGP